VFRESWGAAFLFSLLSGEERLFSDPEIHGLSVQLEMHLPFKAQLDAQWRIPIYAAVKARSGCGKIASVRHD